MNANLAAVLYLIAGVLFILSLRGLSSPASSRQGNLFGMAAVLVAAGAFYAPEAFDIGTPGHIHPQSLVEMSLGVAIGALTFTGSVIAFAKLSGRMSGAPIILPARHIINIVLGLALLLFIVRLVL